MPNYSRGAKDFLRLRWIQRAIDRAETPNVLAMQIQDEPPVIIRLKCALSCLEKWG